MHTFVSEITKFIHCHTDFWPKVYNKSLQQQKMGWQIISGVLKHINYQNYISLPPPTTPGLIPEGVGGDLEIEIQRINMDLFSLYRGGGGGLAPLSIFLLLRGARCWFRVWPRNLF